MGFSDTDVRVVNFSIVQGTNVCLVYVIDAYRPVAGEVTLAVMGFKCKFSVSRLPFFSYSQLTKSRQLHSRLRFPPLLLHQPLGQ